MHKTQKQIIPVLKRQVMTGLQILKTGIRLLAKHSITFWFLLTKYGQRFWQLLIRISNSSWLHLKKVCKSLWQLLGRTCTTLWHALKNISVTLWHIFTGICITGYAYTKTQTARVCRYVVDNQAHVRERLYQYALLMRLHKPIGIFLLLWPTLWTLWIAADGKPDFMILLIFITGVVIMRSTGCVVNDLADRDLDPRVARTIDRPLAAGNVTVKEAIIVALVLLLLAFLLVLQLNPLTIKLSFVAVILAIIYPFSKRFTYMPQLFLGMAFAWAIPMAFAAQTGALQVITWILFMATVLWAMVYDTMYAMVDREDDIKMGMKSTAILFDDADRSIIAVIQLLVLLALVLIGSRMELGRIYYAGIAIATILFIYQQYLIKDRIPERCFAAFLNNNWFGAAVFAGIYFNYQFS